MLQWLVNAMWVLGSFLFFDVVTAFAFAPITDIESATIASLLTIALSDLYLNPKIRRG